MFIDYSISEREFAAGLWQKYENLPRGEVLSSLDMLTLLLSCTSCLHNLRYIVSRISCVYTSVFDVYKASYSELMGIDKMTSDGADAILLVGSILSKMEINGDKVSTEMSYEEFFFELTCNSMKEELVGGALDDENRIVAIKKLSAGTLSSTPLFIGDLAELAAGLDSRRLILAHSHPNTDEFQLSEADSFALEYTEMLLSRLDIELYGHVVISRAEAHFFKL